jgi:hypothetical protein
MKTVLSVHIVAFLKVLRSLMSMSSAPENHAHTMVSLQRNNMRRLLLDDKFDGGQAAAACSDSLQFPEHESSRIGEFDGDSGDNGSISLRADFREP